VFMLVGKAILKLKLVIPMCPPIHTRYKFQSNTTIPLFVKIRFTQHASAPQNHHYAF
jgi:hypothetical protein